MADKKKVFLGIFSILLIFMFSVQGCGIFKKKEEKSLSPEELYKIGEQQLEKRKWEESRELLVKVYEGFPDHILAPRALFLIGYSYYKEKEYEKAVLELEKFMKIHPSNEISDLVQYTLAMSYFDQLKSIERDQGITAKAEAEFKKLIANYPDSRYVSDAKAKLQICYQRLAQKELWIANYYLKQGNFNAAYQRFDSILQKFPNSEIIPEVLYQMAESLVKSNKAEDAKPYYQRIINEFPDSKWAKEAKDKLSRVH